MTWEDLFGILPTKDEVVRQLRTLNRLHTVILLCRINTHLFLDSSRTNPRETVELQRFLGGSFLDEEVVQKANRKFGGDRLDFRRAFHFQQILTTLKWALLEGSATQGIRPDADDIARQQLGRCLIKVNDLLLSPQMRRGIRKWRQSPSINNFLALQLFGGSGFEVNNPPAIPSSVVRSDLVFGEILQKVKPQFDVLKGFREQTGLELEAYMDMTFGILAHYIGNSQEELNRNPGLVILNPKTFFGPNMSGVEAERFWAVESIPVETLVSELAGESASKAHQDFSIFRKRPFIRITDDAVVCVNPSFVQEKLESGLFWSITNNLATTEDRQRMFGTWGECFQEYVNQLLTTSIHKDKETYIPYPWFEDKAHRHESFDAIVCSGEKLAVIECKGGFLSASAKYSEDRNLFLQDLDLKFGCQPGAGVEQLVRKISQVFHVDESKRRRLSGVNATEVAIVVPVLIVQDSFVSSPFTVPWLAKKFRDSMRKCPLDNKLIWLGLVVVDVGELEATRPHIAAREISFVEAVMYRAQKGDPGSDNRIFTYRDAVLSLLEAKNVTEIPHSDFEERFEGIVNRVSTRFFGKSFKRLQDREVGGFKSG